jgi:hypothetical protein
MTTRSGDYLAGMRAAVIELELTGADLLVDAIAEAREAGTIPAEDGDDQAQTVTVDGVPHRPAGRGTDGDASAG